MRSRRNPYTKSAVAFQKDAATHRSSFLDVPLKGLAFTERGFEKLPCDTDELIGVTFRDGTQIVEYLANVANTAILIESALMKAERPRDLVRIEFVFDPSQDFGLEVVKINARAYTLSARSPIAFATKALCTSTALDALYAIEGRDSVDPLLVWHLAEPLRFTDLAPAELKFDIHGGDRAAESAVETAAQIVRAAESLIRKTLSKVVQRPNIDPVAFTELPAALDLGPLRAAFAKFIVTAIGESVGLHEDWRQGLWSSLELFSDGRAHVRLTRFTKDFSAWGEGLYVQNVNARKQVGAVAALVGLICKERAPGLQFESVRVSLSRQQVEQPTVSIEVVGKLIELRFDGDARDALLTPDVIAQTIFNLLSTIPEVASQVNQSSVTAAVTAWADAGVVRKLRSRDFGPHLLDDNPTISQNLAKSEYIHAFAHAVRTANVGTQIYVDSETSAQAARELNKFPTEPDPFKSVKYAGADIYGGVLDTILLHPSAGCLILPGAVAYGARPKTPRMYYQLAASMAILGDIASAAYTKMSGRRAGVSVALHFQRAVNPEVTFDATLRIPQQANDHTLAWSDSISTWTLTPDQMAAIGAYPTLVLEFNNPAELYKRMCAPGPFEATARAIGVILGVKAQRAAFPSFDVPAADLEMVEPGGAEDAGALGRAVYAYQQEFERILLRAVGQNETLSPDAVADAQDRTTALHTLVSRCALALISLRGVRDKVVFSATADANIRSALDSIWGATCLTELTLTELRRMLARMRENQTLARLGQMLDLQVRALSSRIDSLNRELVDPKTSERAVVATEAEREVVVERLTNARRLTREFEQLASYVTALANEMPEFTQASAEVAAGEAVFKELSSPPVPKVVVPPSVSPDPLLPPSDPPSEPPPAHMPPLDVAAAYKEISMDARAHVTDVVELPALDDPDVEAVDCIALGELRWLVKSLRSRMAHAQTELELNAAGTYRFAYSALPGTRHVVGKAADGSYTVTIYIPARRDISRPDAYEDVLLALAAGMEELNTQQGFHTDGEEEPDQYDIYDELST